MDRITFARGKVIQALSGYKFNGVAIPVFDEVVNPSTTLPVISGAQTYIMLQDQQMIYNSVQTYCNPRFNISLTIKVVTIFGNTGSKKLSEDIGDDVLNLLRDDRGKSKLSDISEVQLDVSRSMNEVTSTRVAFSKIFILSFIKNG
jgi:hypothetical protein